jgi:Flp pilus assembly protein TadG
MRRLQMQTWRDERGVALVTVMMVSMVLMGLLIALLSYGIGSQSNSRHDQDWNAALAAANAAVDDYVYRIDNDHNYWLYNAGNPPPDGNTAFTQWTSVPNSTNGGLYRYSVDSSTTKIDGAVKMTISGKVNNVIRTIKVTLRRRTFIDYLYFTNYETLDPALYTGNPFTPAEAQQECAMHYYEGRDSQCTTIYFFDRDTINGPLHSNDAINISGGPTFNGPVSTSWQDPNHVNYLCPGGGCTPHFANHGDPTYKAPLTMPPSNDSIKAETDPRIGGTGCLYTGPTQITLTSAGLMNVVSPFTKSSNCTTGNNISLPSDGVVYVQSVPSDPTDSNYTNGCPYSNPAYPPNLPVPITNDLTQYNCRDGDVFVSGTLKGQLTIAAEHNVEVVADVVYQSGVGGSDLLGLVANNYVEVMHPVSCTSNSSSCNLNRKSGSTFQNPTIDAAVLSVQHSFRVQNYSAGSCLGNLNIVGAIAQQYRGIVGTFSGSSCNTGYTKNYVYDQRLKYLEPPHFIDPVASAWQAVTWTELPPTSSP